jgi:hypothetical protein
MSKRNAVMSFPNAVVGAILRSSLHNLMSGSVMLVEVTGCKTGRLISTPVNYMAVDGSLYTLSSTDRTWWKNLRGGRACHVWLRGIHEPFTGQAIEDPGEVAASLRMLYRHFPRILSYLKIRREPDGSLNAVDLAEASAQRVVIRFSKP